MKANEKAARLGSKSGSGTIQRAKHTSRMARGASLGRRFGLNVGECIIIALALGTAAEIAGRPQ